MKTVQITCFACHRNAVCDDLLRMRSNENCPYCGSSEVLKKTIERPFSAHLSAYGFEKLTEEQKQACISTEGVNYVNAGCGTGKTTLLIVRLQYIIHLRRDNIHIPLVLTFTNNAVDRIRNCLMVRAKDRPVVETFHSFAYRVLLQCRQYLGHFSMFRIRNENDFSLMYERLQAQYPLLYGNISEQELEKQIQQRKIFSKGTYISSLMEDDQNSADEFLKPVLEIQRAWNLLDFDDLINVVTYFLRRSPTLTVLIQEKFKYILVDEAQDLTETELELLDLISAQYRNLFLVGDEDQSIYGWRGASPHITQWASSLTGILHTFQLTANYRSSKSILATAGTFIANNLNRIPKHLTTENKQGVKVLVKACLTQNDEAQMIANSIQLSVDSSLPSALSYSEIAVLARNRTILKEVRMVLSKRKIPVSSYTDVSFHQQSVVKQMIAYLTFLAHPDDFSFAALNESFIPDENWSDFIQQKQAFGETVWTALNRWYREGKPQTAEGFQCLKMLNEAKQEMVKFQTEALAKTTDLIIHYLQGDQEDSELKQFYRYVQNWNRKRGNDFHDFLDHFHMAGQEEESIRTASNYVNLMTIHASKGREFKKVFLCGMNADILPAKQGNLEEERRLLYVGMTRAKSELIISYPMKRFGHPVEASPFVKELLTSGSALFSGIPLIPYKKRR